MITNLRSSWEWSAQADLSSAIQTGALPLTYGFGVAFRLCACTGEWAKVLCPAASFAGVFTPANEGYTEKNNVKIKENFALAARALPCFCIRIMRRRWRKYPLHHLR